MKLLAWIKPSLEGEDNKSSYKRLTALFFVIMDGYIIYSGKIDSEIMLWVHYSILAFILLLTGIISAQNVIEFKNGSKSDKKE